MQVTKLRLSGFKSFGHPTELLIELGEDPLAKFVRHGAYDRNPPWHSLQALAIAPEAVFAFS